MINILFKTCILILLIVIFFNCESDNKPKTQKIVSLNSIKEGNKEIIFKYDDQQLESFLDSIGRLPTKMLMNKVDFVSDSIFKNQLQLVKSIALSDFNKLKQAIKSKIIDLQTAKIIFGNFKIDSSFIERGEIPITLFSFDKLENELDEFAISLGDMRANSSCDLYFFKSNKIISQHIIYHHSGLELKHYIDRDGKTVIYYKKNYDSGSGVWWYNLYFYKYYDNKLIPILNELDNGNLQYPWGFRIFWLESFVEKTNPLTLKMVYYQQLSPNDSSRIVDDSTFVTYHWDKNTKTLLGNYEKTKINKAQLLTYCTSEDNELLFINAYYKNLKNSLRDQSKKHFTLNYLNQIKNQYKYK